MVLVLMEWTSYGQSPKASPEKLQFLPQKAGADTNRVRYLLNMGSYYLFKPGEYKNDLDSAFPYLQRAKDLSDSLNYPRWQHESLLILGEYYFEASDIPRGKACFMQMINDYRKSGDKLSEANTWVKMGDHFSNRDLDTVGDPMVNAYKEAALIYRQLNDHYNETWIRKAIANAHLLQGNLSLAEKELLEVLALQKEYGLTNLHYTYHLLSAVYRVKGNLEKALFYSLEMVKNMEKTGDRSSAGFFYELLGQNYWDLGVMDKSMEYNWKALEEFKKMSYTPKISIYNVSGRIAHGLIRQGRAKEALDFFKHILVQIQPVFVIENRDVDIYLGDCYAAMKEYDLAEKHYLRMISWEERVSANALKIAAYNTIGQFYLDRHQYEKARFYLSKMLLLSPGIAPIASLRDTYLLLFDVDSATGHPEQAIKNYQQYKILNDSLFNLAKSRQIEELQIQYETAQKEKDISLLRAQSINQQQDLKQEGLLRKVALGGIVFLLIIVILVYNRYRLKQNSNARLQVQQNEINQKNVSLQFLVAEKEWLLKEMHHRVKNNLQIVISLLNTQSCYLDNEMALLAIRESQQRMQAISLLHQRLYQTEKLDFVDISDYLYELVDRLRDSFNYGHRVLFDLQIENVDLDASQALPLGLILNEAVSNSMKHAFPGDMEGTISVSLRHIADKNLYILSIRDDGQGLPLGFDHKQDSFGLSLMQGLCEQLGGSFHLESHLGVTIEITFAGSKVIRATRD